MTRSRRVVVEPFQGAKSAKYVRSGVIHALEAEPTVNLVSSRLLEDHAGENDGSPQGYAAIAAALDLLSIVKGRMGSDDAGLVVVLTVVSGRDGRTVGTLEYRAKTQNALRTAVRTRLRRDIAPLLESAAEPSAEDLAEPAATPPAVEEPPAAEEPASEPPPPTHEQARQLPQKTEAPPAVEPPPRAAAPETRCPFLIVEAAGGTLHRAFDFLDESAGDLRGYRLPVAPELRAGLAYFPFAHGGCGLASGFGVELGFERPFGVEARLGGVDLEVTALAHEAALVVHLPFDRFWVTPGVGYHYRHFVISRDFAPGARYLALRPGLEVGFSLARFFGELGFAPHVLLSSGSISDEEWFPDANAFAFSATAEAGAALLDWLEIVLRGSLESYRFDFDVPPNRLRVAGGAYDRYASFSLGLRWLLPGRAPRP